MFKKKKTAYVKRIRTPESCFFCDDKTSPDYKTPEILRKCITERGKISGREYTGICAKHQRLLAREVKKARFLALLPFVNQIK